MDSAASPAAAAPAPAPARTLAGLAAEEVPPRLRPAYYFDLGGSSGDPAAGYLGESPSVIAAVAGLTAFVAREIDRFFAATPEGARGGRTLSGASVFGAARRSGPGEGTWLVIEGPPEPASPGRIWLGAAAVARGAILDVRTGDVVAAEGARVEPGARLEGPCWIGPGSVVRGSASVRRGTWIGPDSVVGGEFKNALLLGQGDYPHPCYAGDSLLGFHSHFGNQVTAANLPLFDAVRHAAVRVELDGVLWETGLRKLGMVLGDHCQIGCNSVSDPGVFCGPWTLVYPLARLSRGFYGPREILKHKPLEHGVMERVPLEG